MNPLAATQRDRIRQHNEENNFGMEEFVNGLGVENVSVEIDKTQPKEERTCFLPKILLLITVVLVLLVGIALLVYFVKRDDNNSPRGKVISEPAEEKCEVENAVLGEIYNINCAFSNAVGIPENVIAKYKYVAGAKTSDFNCTKSGSSANCIPLNATTCSLVSDVEIRFSDPNGKTVLMRTVSIDIKAPDRDFSTSIKQVYNERNSTPIFQLSCESRGYCLSHDMKFVEDKSGKDISNMMSCKTTYSDVDGYSISCYSEVSADVIQRYGNESALYCKLMHGTEEVYRREFNLPDCTDFAVQNKECNYNETSLFNCEDTSTTETNCSAICKVAKECYALRVKEFSSNSSSCATKCSLDWCRHEDTRFIDTSGKLSFEQLCRFG